MDDFGLGGVGLKVGDSIGDSIERGGWLEVK